MLARRVVTALILAPAFVAAIWLLPSPGFALLIGVLGVLAALEWGHLCGLGRGGALLYAAGLVLVGGAFWARGGMHALLLAGVLWWLVAALAVFAYPAGRSLWARPWLRSAAGLPVLLPAWAGFVELQAAAGGAWMVLWVMLLVWGADVGAYFAGHAWGRRRLAPSVSPGKTWEGLAGGGALALLVGIVGALAAGVDGSGWLAALALTLLLLGVSVIGDLTESVIKRAAGVKDSGHLIPGHGGILDRIDSVLAAVPVAAVVLLRTGFRPGGWLA